MADKPSLIDDALPNQTVSDAEFRETEVTEVETPNEDIVQIILYLMNPKPDRLNSQLNLHCDWIA